jgi:hypothetical protein
LSGTAIQGVGQRFCPLPLVDKTSCSRLALWTQVNCHQRITTTGTVRGQKNCPRSARRILSISHFRPRTYGDVPSGRLSPSCLDGLWEPIHKCFAVDGLCPGTAMSLGRIWSAVIYYRFSSCCRLTAPRRGLFLTAKLYGIRSTTCSWPARRPRYIGGCLGKKRGADACLCRLGGPAAYLPAARTAADGEGTPLRSGCRT